MANRIKVIALFLHHSLWGKRIRGDERRFLEIVKRASTLGFDFCVIEYAPSLQKHYYGRRIYRSIELRNRGLLYTLLHVILLALRLRKKYDIIYAYNQDFLNVLSSLIFKLVQRKPLVIVVQSLQDIEFPLKKLKELYGASVLGLFFIQVHRLLLRVAFMLADVLITTTNSLKNSLTARFPRIKRKVFVTGNGVNLDIFKPSNMEKKYDAIFLGRLHIMHKGLDKLLLAWRIIVNRFPKAKLVLVGGYESERDQRLLSDLLNKFLLKENVIITGFVKDEDVVTLLNSSKVFISLSIYEGFGLSILEAMACGIPCIISNLQVFKELHGNVPFYVNAQNYKSVALTLCKLLMSHNFNSLGTLLRKHAEKFPWEAVVGKEMALIKIIASLHHRAKKR